MTEGDARSLDSSSSRVQGFGFSPIFLRFRWFGLNSGCAGLGLPKA